jgi:hypothetical protein
MQMTVNDATVNDETTPPPETNISDLVWGLENIGREINRNAKQTSEILKHTNLLNGVVRKVSHKWIVGSRSGLQNLPKTLFNNR